jgi:hypothetical protein
MKTIGLMMVMSALIMAQWHTEGVELVAEIVVVEPIPSLPVKCRPYYNDGTERWINCMGVGYVREQDEEQD